MLFSSASYIFLFVPIAVAGYFLFYKLRLSQAARLWLCLANITFYAISDLTFLPLMLGSILFNFTAVHGMKKTEGRIRKTLFIGAILVNLGLLSLYKYTDPFLDFLNHSISTNFTLLKLAFPLGISFFTFQQLAYLIDSFQNKAHEYKFINYVIFVTFFPHLLAGPLVNHKQIIPQFASPRNHFIKWNHVHQGLIIFAIGLFKKSIIADSLATYADFFFDYGPDASMLEAWVGSLCYTFQLYFDFAGYSEMAVGVGLMFNIHLPINFNSPMIARDMVGFWSRWHMTMTGWFRDYLFTPLSFWIFRRWFAPLSKRGMKPADIHFLLSIPITAVMFTTIGLWHEGSLKAIIFGLFNGGGVLWVMLWKRIGFRLPYLLAHALTLLSFNIACVFFRAHSLGRAGNILQSMMGKYAILPSRDGYFFERVPYDTWLDPVALGTSTHFLAMLENGALIAALLLCLHMLPHALQLTAYMPLEAHNRVQQWLYPRLRPFFAVGSLRAAILAGLLIFLGMAGVFMHETSPFIYFAF
ncbi:MBOAT family protein [bacterium]|nr:MBOAT family protein [bacterium]